MAEGFPENEEIKNDGRGENCFLEYFQRNMNSGVKIHWVLCNSSSFIKFLMKLHLVC